MSGVFGARRAVLSCFAGACALTWMSPGAAMAAESTAVTRLSLDEALARAAAHSPLVRRARRERDVVAAARVGAGQILPANPVVLFSAGARRDSSSSVPPATGPELIGHVEQQIEIGGQRGTRLKEVARAVDAAEARERLALIETRARVRSAYVAALLTLAQVESAKRREELGARVLESARARVAAGAASSVEVNLAEVERGRLAYERLEAELLVGRAMNELRLQLGLPPDAPVELTTTLGEPELIQTPLETLIAEAQRRRQEVAALEASRSQLDAQIVRLRREVVPSPSLFVDVMSQQPGQLYVGGGLAFSLPLWRRNQGPIAVARAERARADEELGILSSEIALEVAGAVRATRTHSEEARLWSATVLPAAENNVELVTQGWRAGKFDIFRVVQVAREAGEARRRQLEVLGALWNAAIALERAVGIL